MLYKHAYPNDLSLTPSFFINVESQIHYIYTSNK